MSVYKTENRSGKKLLDINQCIILIKLVSTNWDNFYEEGKARWDNGKASPALVKLLEDEETRSLIPEQGYGLVPGCELDYDVKLLATKNRHITGMDLSPTCVDTLNKKCPNTAAENYDFQNADFYKCNIPIWGHDLVYDYSFFCAMPPPLRPDWAARYAEPIKKDSGILITLIYPIGDHTDSPPYAVNEQLYSDLLSPYFDLLHIKDAQGHETRLGKEKMAIWKRKE